MKKYERKLNLKLSEFQGARNNLTSTNYDLKITKDDIKRLWNIKLILRSKSRYEGWKRRR